MNCFVIRYFQDFWSHSLTRRKNHQGQFDKKKNNWKERTWFKTFWPPYDGVVCEQLKGWRKGSIRCQPVSSTFLQGVVLASPSYVAWRYDGQRIATKFSFLQHKCVEISKQYTVSLMDNMWQWCWHNPSSFVVSLTLPKWMCSRFPHHFSLYSDSNSLPQPFQVFQTSKA